MFSSVDGCVLRDHLEDVVGSVVGGLSRLTRLSSAGLSLLKHSLVGPSAAPGIVDPEWSLPFIIYHDFC